mgnify:CR=1 FL=1
MQTYPTGYTESHRMAEKIFREILPRHSMAVREEQIALCHEVLDTLYNKEISLCEAGVGTGKTLAYLVGCILWQMNRPERMKLPIVISTSSVALQDAILTEYLPDLSAILLDEGIITAPITAVVRKGKERFVCDARLAEEHRRCIRNERGRKAACALQKIFWTWIISRNFPGMTAAAFVCRSPARAIAFCARIAATSNICGIP